MGGGMHNTHKEGSKPIPLRAQYAHVFRPHASFPLSSYFKKAAQGSFTTTYASAVGPMIAMCACIALMPGQLF